MRKIKNREVRIYLLLFFASLFCSPCFAQGQKTSPSFHLGNGDRVVFLGNSLFENDMQFGYLEMALATRFPGKAVTYRNLGWTGDNVWGEARSTFTNPPTPYEHLMNQLTSAAPTLVFIAYGNVESQQGEAGLPRFAEGLNKLLDKTDQLGASVVLLSPIPVVSDDPAAEAEKRNANIRLYASEIAKISAARRKHYVDLYNPVLEASRSATLLENGVHLNETGYYYLAGILEKALGLPPRGNLAQLDFEKAGVKGNTAVKVIPSEDKSVLVSFSLNDSLLPLPLPRHEEVADTRLNKLKFTGLKKGYYALFDGNEQVAAASAKAWAEGVPIRQGSAFERTREIRQMVLKKNEQFFFQYRPLNRTYILGFRSYEQGRHAKGLEDQNLIIKWLEGQIALRSIPEPTVYTLKMLK